jgi:clan AA aspartic protease
MNSPDLFAYATLTLSNPLKSNLNAITVSALADTGSNFLIIPDHVCVQLGIDEHGDGNFREMILADGRRRKAPLVGPITLQFENRRCNLDAVVMGDQVILGMHAMATMDLVIFTEKQLVMVNPDTPNFAAALAKGNKQHIHG